MSIHPMTKVTGVLDINNKRASQPTSRDPYETNIKLRNLPLLNRYQSNF